LKVNESLPDSIASEWSLWLNDLPSRVQNAIESGWKAKSIQKTINTLFKKIFSLDQAPPNLNNALQLPCLSWNKDEETEVIKFKTKDNIYWLDKPYLADVKVKSALLKHGINLFIRELDEGTNASEWMGMQRLSDRISVNDKHINEDHKKTEGLQERFSERRKYLAKLPAINKQLPEVELKVVDQLELELLDQKRLITSTAVLWWHGHDTSVYFIDSDHLWRGGALAIANAVTNKKYASDIELFLKADNEKELLDRLRDMGVPESSLAEMEISRLPTEDISSSPVNDVEDEPTVPSDHPDIIPTTEDGPVVESPEFVPPRTTTTHHPSNDDWKKAQEWVRSRLKFLFDPLGWDISKGEERMTVVEPDSGYSEIRATDVVLRGNGKVIHVEVKFTKSGTVFWSKGEVNQARDNIGHYFMLIVAPSGEANEPYKLSWLFNPLEDLKPFLFKSQKGVWPSRQTKQISIDQNDPWHIPIPPRELNFSFELKVSPDDFELGSVKDILEQIILRDEKSS
jgi:hypothetical protein